jgi:hypothetical protein
MSLRTHPLASNGSPKRTIRKNTGARLRGSLWRGAAAHQRRLFSISPAHDQRGKTRKGGGTRLAIVAGSSLYRFGGIGRAKFVVDRENDWLEGIVLCRISYSITPGFYLSFDSHEPQEHRKGKIHWLTRLASFRRCAKALAPSATRYQGAGTSHPAVWRFQRRRIRPHLRQRGLRL